MTHQALIERITRSLAYMLRHQPEQFDLELDEYGYANLDDVVRALNERLSEPVDESDLVEAVHSGDRIRYEIQGDQIRALYGHSIEVKPGEPSKPPPMLYVGVSSDDADRAQRYGLRAGRRRFLHLALTPEDALETGRRAARDYVVITVNALDAWEEGINFYDRKSLFLSDPIPTHFLQVGEVQSDGYEEAESHGRSEGPGRGPSRHGDRHGDRPRRAGGGGRRESWREERAPAPLADAEHAPAAADHDHEHPPEPESFEPAVQAEHADRPPRGDRRPERHGSAPSHGAPGGHGGQGGGSHARSPRGPEDRRGPGRSPSGEARHHGAEGSAAHMRESGRSPAGEGRPQETRHAGERGDRGGERGRERGHDRGPGRGPERSHDRGHERAGHDAPRHDAPRHDAPRHDAPRHDAGRAPRAGHEGHAPRADDHRGRDAHREPHAGEPRRHERSHSDEPGRGPRGGGREPRPQREPRDSQAHEPRRPVHAEGSAPAPERRAPPPPAPRRENERAPAASEGAFGLGIFEEKPSARARPEPAAPRERERAQEPEPRPKPAQPAAREADDSGFGAGI